MQYLDSFLYHLLICYIYYTVEGVKLGTAFAFCSEDICKQRDKEHFS
jgi:hypothetical protein